MGASGPLPAVLYNHAHGGEYHIGKEELLSGRSALQAPPYAEALTARGYSALCIDHWAFGERRGRTETETYKHMIWHGQVMWGMMVYDSLRALDYLVSRPDVDAARIGTLGISMGSTLGWWTAALDTRIKVCVDICCLSDYQALIETHGLDGHGIYYYVPRLLKHFTTAQINALIAPRPHLGLAGNCDSLTPPAGLDRIDAELKQVYAALDAPDAWQLRRYDIGHFETAAMRAEILAFLERWL
jgi:dienelactone hydrolase